MTVLLVALAMALGLACTIVPGVPGLVVIWVAALIYGLVEGFGTAGVSAMIVSTGLLLAGSAATYILPSRAGRDAGATRETLAFAVVGALVGMVVLPVLGLPIGAVAGVWVAERLRLGDWGQAWTTTRRVVVGYGAGTLLEVLAGIAMVITWIAWAVAG